MWTRALPFFASVCLFTVTAAAQAENDAPPSEPGGPPPAEPESPTTSSDSEGAVSETSSVQASPDVQAQVGLGTEKDTPEQPGYDPSSPFEGEAERERRARKKDYGHFMQLGARGGLSIPYKIMFRFDDSPTCDIDEDQADGEEGKVCGLFSPVSLDLALSFALLDSLEPYIWMRFGLNDERRTQTKALRVFGAGLRIYTMNESMFKVFFEPALGVETEGALNDAAAASANYDTDFYVHLNAGLQVDFIRHMGVYVALGPNVSFVRAITTTFEANVGLQFRLP